jgi:hypothetical protein
MIAMTASALFGRQTVQIADKAATARVIAISFVLVFDIFMMFFLLPLVSTAPAWAASNLARGQLTWKSPFMGETEVGDAPKGASRSQLGLAFYKHFTATRFSDS